MSVGVRGILDAHVRPSSSPSPRATALRGAGELRTPHGVVQTPAFMPVGTRGAVKALTHRDLDDLGAEIILGNTYHLYLKPGDGLIARGRAACTASSAGIGRS